MDTSKFKVIIFDFDGTLADSLPLCVEAFRRAVEPACGRLLTDAEIKATFGPSEEGTIAALAPQRYDECMESFLRHYDALHGEMCPSIFDGMREVLHSLKDRGFRVALVTGKGPLSCDISLGKLGLSGFFDHVGCGVAEGDIKSRRIGEILEKWELEPTEVLYVGDSPFDVDSCRRVGAPIAAAAWAPDARREGLIAKDPDAIFFTVADFAEWLTGVGTGCGQG
ncbi:MAG: HAD family hydrolase [Alistipes sp.]|jgi:phosphoglycolate phosphatase/pyrophosphatase PpaX|nr:HAD family hydrolase [Alistipes sp.]